jgi:hypothetical protein
VRSHYDEGIATHTGPESCAFLSPGISPPVTWVLGGRGRRIGGVKLIWAHRRNCGNQSFRCQGRRTSGINRDGKRSAAMTGLSVLPPGGPPNRAERPPPRSIDQTAEPAPHIGERRFDWIAGQHRGHRHGCVVAAVQTRDDEFAGIGHQVGKGRRSGHGSTSIACATMVRCFAWSGSSGRRPATALDELENVELPLGFGRD